MTGNTEARPKRKGTSNLPAARREEALIAERAALALDYMKSAPSGMLKSNEYGPEIEFELLERLAGGETLSKICKDEHMPCRAAVLKWIHGKTPRKGFKEAYEQARLQQLYGIADEMRDIADDATNDWKADANGNPVVDKEHISRSKLRIDTRKWELSKLLANVFGDKIAVTDPSGGPLTVVVRKFTGNAGN